MNHSIRPAKRPAVTFTTWNPPPTRGCADYSHSPTCTSAPSGTREGLYIAESSQACCAARWPPGTAAFLLPGREVGRGLADVLDAIPASRVVGSPGVLEEITGFHLHRGAWPP